MTADAAGRLPWFKFYGRDWRADAALRGCSLAARGLWIDLLSLMDEAVPRGHLLVAGKPPGAQALARILGAEVAEIEARLAELEAAGVFSRTDSGVIFSRRMVRDEATAQAARVNGRRGGNPALAVKDKLPLNPPDMPDHKPRARANQSQITDLPSLRTGRADAPPAEAEIADAEVLDARTLLFRHGLAQVRDLTGKPRDAAARMVGRWLRDVGDDCPALSSIIADAVDARPADPAGWISAAVAARAAPPREDPWGLRAWIARQPDVTLEPADDGGEPVACIGDGVVHQWAEHVAEAAGLAPSWRGSWDAMGAWMREGVDLRPAVLSAIRDQAARAAARGEGVASMRFFDAAVRAAAGRRAA